MSVIEVQAPGLFTTVQDLGRPGFGPIGVSASGAADPLSLRLGNLLVGNPEGAAALEMTLLGGTFRFPEGAWIALAGSDFAATVDAAPAPLWTARELPAGAMLKVGHTQSGARCYLCVRGGIAVPLFLGSASTHVLSGLGGLDGRPLKRGDVLAIGPEPSDAAYSGGTGFSLWSARKILRVTDGPQFDWFSGRASRQFYDTIYRVTEESNRVGLRLQGPSIEASISGSMMSEGAALGCIQITPAGQPVILFVEQQTTGGYPKIANIITADLPSVGQLRPGDEIRFERVAIAEARALLFEQERILKDETDRHQL
jgi:antagonist of KipI